MTDTAPAIRIGVSACLLGANVRFDGQHKRDPFLVEELGPRVEWVSVCPEVEVGMGTPREPVRLVSGPRDGGPRMLGVTSGQDWTARMTGFAAARVRALAREQLSGFVLKSKSPSCGMARVPIHRGEGAARAPATRGAGLFAAALARAFPNLPIEEEGRLQDARLRDNFIERVFAYTRLRAMWAERWTLRSLIAFHTAHKMALLAHSTEGYRALGRLVARAKTMPRAELRARYEAGFMATLARAASPGRHANVLMHLLGYLKHQLSAADKQEVLELIEAQRRTRLPLAAPLVLLAHHARRHDVPYLLGQTYLAPSAEERQIRQRV